MSNSHARPRKARPDKQVPRQSHCPRGPHCRSAHPTEATRMRWSVGRRQSQGPRHADECCHSPALRAWRAPQSDPLARTACFGRAAPPGAPPRFLPGGRPPAQNRTRSVSRSSPVTFFTERDSSLCNLNGDQCQRNCDWPSRSSWPDLFPPSRLIWHSARLNEIAGTSPAMTKEGERSRNGITPPAVWASA